MDTNLYEVGDYVRARPTTGGAATKAKVLEVAVDPEETEKYGVTKYTYLVDFGKGSCEFVKEDHVFDEKIVAETSTGNDAEEAARQRQRTAEKHGFNSPCWYSFKNPGYVRFRRQKVPKGRSWKSLAKVLHQENYEYLPPGVPTYMNVQAPPPIHPPKKYCDLTGLPAKYTDPRTGLRYASHENFKVIQDLPVETVQEILALRNAQPPAGLH